MTQHHALDYLEWPAADLAATKTFFENAFDWRFTDYGPDYIAFDRRGVEGGFYRAEATSLVAQGAALAVLYSENLEATQTTVEQCGGRINKAIFSFPGGRRFHFLEPSGNEFAVWSDKT